MAGFFVEKIKASGAGKTDSILVFTGKLNVVHGKSDSGKTMAGNCIAYAMGSSKEPFSPEVTGYDTVTATFRTGSGFSIEVSREVGKDIVSVVSDDPEISNGTYSIDSKDGKEKESLNAIMLHMIGLDYVPKVGKNSNSDKVRLTWKNLLRALYLDKETMGRSDYVMIPKSSYEKTPFLSVLLFIVYGQDFSEKDPQTKATIRKAQFEAKMEFIKQKKSDLELKLETANKRIQSSVNGNIQEVIDSYADSLDTIEREIEETILKSKDYYHTIIAEEQKHKSNHVLLERYENLRSQYIADIKRLNNIAEGENMLFDFPATDKCPLCGEGVVPSHLMASHIEAAKAELKRTVNLLSDLEKAETEVKAQIQSSKQIINDLKKKRKACIENIDKQLKPAAASIRSILSSYEESIALSQRISFYEEMLHDLKGDVESIEKENEEKRQDAKKNNYKPREFFQQDMVDCLTSYAQTILGFCNYHNYSQTSFDLDSFDLQVNGVDKSLVHGQGYCSLFNSVLYMMFREYFHKKAEYKPGFMMIDTPLLGLVEKIGETESNEFENKIYEYLAMHSGEGQVIIFDNKTQLPDFLYERNDVSVIEFRPDGRKGFLIDYNGERNV